MGNQLAYPEVDLSGKVALVTGGNTGIGYETAKGLARLGAHTFIACRSKERAEKAIKNIRIDLLQDEEADERSGRTSEKTDQVTGKESTENVTEVIQSGRNEDVEVDNTEVPNGKVNGVVYKSAEAERQLSSKDRGLKLEYIPLDLASFQSTKECVRIFKERNLPLHILVNNAGIAGFPYNVTVDGLENQFQVNHLGPVLLTLELLPILLETAASSGDVRIVFVTSDGQFKAERFNPDGLNKTKEEDYTRLLVYCNTKLYNVLTGFSLQKKLKGKNITVSSAHPGFVNTEITRGVKDWKVLSAVYELVSNVVARTPKEGAATSLNCAVNPELNSQQHFYYESCKAKESSEQSRNELFQEQLWERSFMFLKEYISPDIWEEFGPKTCKPENKSLESVPTSQPDITRAEENGDQQELKEGDDTNSTGISDLLNKEDSKLSSNNISAEMIDTEKQEH